jgi:eukaryotic-like serine/threonine-protein kinase
VIGKTLGPYQILDKLGEGGMGEVYRARDMRLEREVAIKVLSASVALDADRLARFDREARVLASLNHPNIAAIYGVEQTGDLQALVLELVEGETLSARLKGQESGLPVSEAVAIARQLVDALDAAHEKGIVHRDLKPANISLTSEGIVKVLDFGLAKAATPAASGFAANIADSPTMNEATRDGVIPSPPTEGRCVRSPISARGRW